MSVITPRPLALAFAFAWTLACGAPSGGASTGATTSGASATGSTAIESTSEATTLASTSEASSSTQASTSTSEGESDTGGALPPRILFVGNSYVFTNDLPGTVDAIASAGGAPLAIESIAVAGASVADHLANPEVIAALAEPWAVVVLQGQSLEPITQPMIFEQAVVDFAAALDPASELLLFETWARREGDAVLIDLGMSAAEMQAALTEGYAAAALASGGAVAPVGQAWALAIAEAPEIELYIADGSHPSVAGTYLAAALFFARLTGEDAVLSEYTPPGLDPAAADLLEGIADAALAGG